MTANIIYLFDNLANEIIPIWWSFVIWIILNNKNNCGRHDTFDKTFCKVCLGKGNFATFLFPKIDTEKICNKKWRINAIITISKNIRCHFLFDNLENGIISISDMQITWYHCSSWKNRKMRRQFFFSSCSPKSFAK